HHVVDGLKTHRVQQFDVGLHRQHLVHLKHVVHRLVPVRPRLPRRIPRGGAEHQPLFGDDPLPVGAGRPRLPVHLRASTFAEAAATDPEATTLDGLPRIGLDLRVGGTDIGAAFHALPHGAAATVVVAVLVVSAARTRQEHPAAAAVVTAVASHVVVVAVVVVDDGAVSGGAHGRDVLGRRHDVPRGDQSDQAHRHTATGQHLATGLGLGLRF